MALSRLLAMLDAGLKEMVGFLHDSKSLKMVKRMAIEAQTPTRTNTARVNLGA